MLGKLVEIANNLFDKRCGNLRSLADMKYDRNLVSPYLDQAPPLSEGEKNEIRARWGSIIPYLNRGYDFYRALKYLNGFSADYLPASYYYPIVECTLNPKPVKDKLSHKSISELLYKDIVKFPYTIVRRFNGVYFDAQFNPLTPDEASQLIGAEAQSFLYKPSTSTCQGKGIELIDGGRRDELSSAIRSGKIVVDFVAQRFVSQSDDTKVFNPSSLNCMRITTLNLNGQITVCSRALKCGPTNSIVDNIGTGKRGVAVGIDENGFLQPYGFYGNGERAESHNGVYFKGRKIEGFDRVLSKAIDLHSVNPVCKLIGWDLALDAQREVVLIEGNTVCPSISFEQMATGPIFGDRVGEVVEFVRKNK